jgi:uncharacterized protein YacL
MNKILRSFVLFNYCLGRWITNVEYRVLKLTFAFLAFEIGWSFVSINITFNKIQDPKLLTLSYLIILGLFFLLFDKTIVKYIHNQKFHLDFKKMSKRKFVLYRLCGLFIIIFSLIQIFIFATLFPRN